MATGNSSAARRARVKLQLRDKKGRWIEMGRGAKWYSSSDGKELSGTVVGAKQNTAIVALTDNADPNAPLRTVDVPMGEIEMINEKATLMDPRVKQMVADNVKSLTGKDLKQFNARQEAINEGKAAQSKANLPEDAPAAEEQGIRDFIEVDDDDDDAPEDTPENGPQEYTAGRQELSRDSLEAMPNGTVIGPRGKPAESYKKVSASTWQKRDGKTGYGLNSGLSVATRDVPTDADIVSMPVDDLTDDSFEEFDGNMNSLKPGDIVQVATPNVVGRPVTNGIFQPDAKGKASIKPLDFASSGKDREIESASEVLGVKRLVPDESAGGSSNRDTAMAEERAASEPVPRIDADTAFDELKDDTIGPPGLGADKPVSKHFEAAKPAKLLDRETKHSQADYVTESLGKNDLERLPVGSTVVDPDSEDIYEDGFLKIANNQWLSGSDKELTDWDMTDAGKNEIYLPDNDNNPYDANALAYAQKRHPAPVEAPTTTEAPEAPQAAQDLPEVPLTSVGDLKKGDRIYSVVRDPNKTEKTPYAKPLSAKNSPVGIAPDPNEEMGTVQSVKVKDGKPAYAVVLGDDGNKYFPGAAHVVVKESPETQKYLDAVAERDNADAQAEEITEPTPEADAPEQAPAPADAPEAEQVPETQEAPTPEQTPAPEQAPEAPVEEAPAAPEKPAQGDFPAGKTVLAPEDFKKSTDIKVGDRIMLTDNEMAISPVTSAYIGRDPFHVSGKVAEVTGLRNIMGQNATSKGKVVGKEVTYRKSDGSEGVQDMYDFAGKNKNNKGVILDSPDLRSRVAADNDPVSETESEPAPEAVTPAPQAPAPAPESANPASTPEPVEEQDTEAPAATPETITPTPESTPESAPASEKKTYPDKGKSLTNPNGEVFTVNKEVVSPRFGKGTVSIVLPANNAVRVEYEDGTSKVTQVKNLSLAEGAITPEASVDTDSLAVGESGINPANGKRFLVGRGKVPMSVGDEVEYTKSGKTQTGRIAAIYPGTKSASVKFDDGSTSTKKASTLSKTDAENNEGAESAPSSEPARNEAPTSAPEPTPKAEPKSTPKPSASKQEETFEEQQKRAAKEKREAGRKLEREWSQSDREIQEARDAKKDPNRAEYMPARIDERKTAASNADFATNTITADDLEKFPIGTYLKEDDENSRNFGFGFLKLAENEWLGPDDGLYSDLSMMENEYDMLGFFPANQENPVSPEAFARDKKRYGRKEEPQTRPVAEEPTSAPEAEETPEADAPEAEEPVADTVEEAPVEEVEPTSDMEVVPGGTVHPEDWYNYVFPYYQREEQQAGYPVGTVIAITRGKDRGKTYTKLEDGNWEERSAGGTPLRTITPEEFPNQFRVGNAGRDDHYSISGPDFTGDRLRDPWDEDKEAFSKELGTGLHENVYLTEKTARRLPVGTTATASFPEVGNKYEKATYDGVKFRKITPTYWEGSSNNGEIKHLNNYAMVKLSTDSFVKFDTNVPAERPEEFMPDYPATFGDSPFGMGYRRLSNINDRDLYDIKTSKDGLSGGNFDIGDKIILTDGTRGVYAGRAGGQYEAKFFPEGSTRKTPQIIPATSIAEAWRPESHIKTSDPAKNTFGDNYGPMNFDVHKDARQQFKLGDKVNFGTKKVDGTVIETANGGNLRVARDASKNNRKTDWITYEQINNVYREGLPNEPYSGDVDNPHLTGEDRQSTGPAESEVDTTPEIEETPEAEVTPEVEPETPLSEEVQALDSIANHLNENSVEGSRDEKRAAGLYLGGARFNRALRGQEPMDEYLQAHVDALTSYIDKQPEFGQETTLYRGMSRQFLPDAQDRIGEVITEPAFMSTSLKVEEAARFSGGDGSQFLEIKARPEDKGLPVNMINKGDYAPLDVLSREAEILLRPNTSYQITGVESRQLDNGNTYDVVLAEIVDTPDEITPLTEGDRKTSIAEWEGSLEAVTDEVYKDEYSNAGNRITAAIQHLNGMDGAPTVVNSREEFDSLPGRSLFRGVSSQEQADQFTSGPNWVGDGGSGSGIYTSTNRARGQSFQRADGGALIEMKLPENAEIVDGETLERERQADLARATEEGSIVGQFLAEGDLGRYASARGLDGYTLKPIDPYDDDEEFIVLTDRGSVAVLSQPADSRSEDEDRGEEPVAEAPVEDPAEATDTLEFNGRPVYTESGPGRIPDYKATVEALREAGEDSYRIDLSDATKKDFTPDEIEYDFDKAEKGGPMSLLFDALGDYRRYKDSEYVNDTINLPEPQEEEEQPLYEGVRPYADLNPTPDQQAKLDAFDEQMRDSALSEDEEAYTRAADEKFALMERIRLGTEPESDTVPEPEPVDETLVPGTNIKRTEPFAMPGEKFPPTRQQQDVADAVIAGMNTLVQAKAGAGKTTSLETIARRIGAERPDENIVYIAFNKSVQLEGEKRMPKNVEARTGHAIAYAWSPEWMQKRSRDDNSLRRPDEVAKHIGITKPIRIPGDDNITVDEQAMYAMRTADAYASSADDELGENHIPERFKDAPDAVKEALIKNGQAVWDDLSNPKGELKFSLDAMRKHWALSRPDFSKPGQGTSRPAQVLFLDEAQDTPPVLAKVVEDQTIQKVIVGDQDQAIYGFTGATDYLATAGGDVELPLNKSWRFGPEVADVGNRFLEMLDSKTRVVGGGPSSNIVQRVENPDAILVRSNSGMIGEIINELDQGRTVGVPAKTKGELWSLVETVRYLKGEGPTPSKMHDDLAAFRNWTEVVDAAEKGDDPKVTMVANLVKAHGTFGLANTIKQIVEDSAPIDYNVMDHGTVVEGDSFAIKDLLKQAGFNWREVPGRTIASGKNAGKPLKMWTATGSASAQAAKVEKAKSLIPEPPKPDVIVSTAHKAKGLEWGRVRIGGDFKGPKIAENGEVIMPEPEELRLAYVAVTRAEKELEVGSLDYVFDYSTDNGGADADGNLPTGRQVPASDPNDGVPDEPVVATTPEVNPTPDVPPAPEGGYTVADVADFPEGTRIVDSEGNAPEKLWEEEWNDDGYPLTSEEVFTTLANDEDALIIDPPPSDEDMWAMEEYINEEGVDVDLTSRVPSEVDLSPVVADEEPAAGVTGLPVDTFVGADPANTTGWRKRGDDSWEMHVAGTPIGVFMTDNDVQKAMDASGATPVLPESPDVAPSANPEGAPTRAEDNSYIITEYDGESAHDLDASDFAEMPIGTTVISPNTDAMLEKIGDDAWEWRGKDGEPYDSPPATDELMTYLDRKDEYEGYVVYGPGNSPLE